MENQTEYGKGDTYQNRIDDHGLQIELQTLPGLRTDTGNTDTDEFYRLAAQHRAEHMESSYQLEQPGCHPVVQGNRQIHDDLDDQEYIDATAKGVIHLLLLFGFFCRHGLVI
jgi:hypothetical protein